MKTPRPHPPLRLALAAGFAFIFGFARAADFTSTWNGTTGNWTDTGRWTTPSAPGTFPNNGGSTYDAIQTAGTITLNQNITIQKFTLSGGQLQVVSNFTTNEQFTWSGGGISVGGGATLTNASGSLFTTNFDGLMGVFNSGNGTFNNAGTFTKSGGTGTTDISNTSNGFTVAFNNTGIVNADSGKLSINGGGTSTGVFNVASGATLQFGRSGVGGGTQTLTAASSVNGAGNLSFDGGTTNLNGDYNLTGALSATGGTGNITLVNETATSVAVSGGGTLNLNGGTITASTFNMSAAGTRGGTGTLTVTGLSTLSSNGGAINGGTTNAQGGISFNGGGTLSLVGASTVLNNSGAANWTSGTIRVGAGGTLNNLSGGTFTTNFDGLLRVDSGGNGTFNNAGTFTKSGGTGTTNISDVSNGFRVTFNNTGTVNANSGTLAFLTLNMQDGTLTGAATANASTFNWSGGTLSGTGSTTVASGTITTTGAKGLDRTLNNTGTMTFTGTLGSGGQVEFGVGNSTPGVINNSGTFNLSSGASFQIANANAGHAINNSGNWNVSGGGFTNTVNTGIQFNNSGAVSVTGSSTFVTLGGGTQTGSFSVAGGSELWLIGSDLNSGSSVTGAGKVTLGGTTINTGSTYNTTGETALRGGVTQFNTSATTGTVTGGTNQSQLTVSGATTKLKVNGTFTNNTQYTTLEGGAIIETTAFNLNGGELNGNGSINGPLTSNATIAPGASPGQIIVNGNTILGSGSILNFEVGAGSPVTNYDVLTVNGTVMLGGELRLAMLSNFGTITPGDTFAILTSTSPITGLFSNINPGQRLISDDLLASFVVNYGAGSPFGSNQVVLSDFLNLAPEPSRAMLLMLGACGLMMRRRREQRFTPGDLTANLAG